jgi:hypothetical protein
MSYPITVTDIGTQTWFAGGTNPFKLGVYFSGNSDAIGDWTSEPVRFSLPNDVAPGASAAQRAAPSRRNKSATSVLPAGRRSVFTRTPS